MFSVRKLQLPVLPPHTFFTHDATDFDVIVRCTDFVVTKSINLVKLSPHVRKLDP